MTKYIPCLLLSLTIGCGKIQGRLLGSFSVYKNVDKYYFVGAGQSNMQRQNLSGVFPHSVNVAVGGTSLQQWMKGAGTGYYESILTACKAQSLPCVLLFWQGETNGITADGYPWDVNFVSFVSNLRKDLGVQIPVVYAQIGQMAAPEYTSWFEVQSMQASVNHALPALDMVTVKDLYPDSGDGIHYGQDQYPIVQQRLLKDWESMGEF